MHQKKDFFERKKMTNLQLLISFLILIGSTNIVFSTKKSLYNLDTNSLCEIFRNLSLSEIGKTRLISKKINEKITEKEHVIKNATGCHNSVINRLSTSMYDIDFEGKINTPPSEQIRKLFYQAIKEGNSRLLNHINKLFLKNELILFDEKRQLPLNSKNPVWALDKIFTTYRSKKNNNSPFHEAMQTSNLKAIRYLSYLVKNKATLLIEKIIFEIYNDEGEAFLHTAIRYNNKEAFTYFFEKIILETYKEKELLLVLSKITHLQDRHFGDTLLHSAVRYNRPAILQFLLQLFRKYERNLHCPQEIYNAIKTGNYQHLVDVLQSNKLHPDGLVNIQNATFVTLAHQLYKSKDHPIIKTIKKYCGAAKSSLYHAIELEQNIAVLNLLYNYGANIHAYNNRGKTLLELAREKKHINAESYLITLIK